MSGGVDSSVAAAVLCEQGYEVIGVTMQVWPDAGTASERACCSLSAVADARRVAAKLGIPHYTLNLQEEFRQAVIAPFIAEYARGLTPNPCVNCNRWLKFGLLLERARTWEAEFVATGHYAQVRREDGHWFIHRGLDRRKDQSYALYSMTQEQLAHTLLPLGGLEKTQVREMAREMGLRVAEKPDSQEICFVPDNDYRRFLRATAPESVQPGEIVHEDGRVLGKHGGIAFFTIGQRRGLGISTPEPIFVTRLDAARRRVIVGPADALLRTEVTATDVIFSKYPAEAWQMPRPVMAMLRYKMVAQPAMAHVRNQRLHVTFATPQRAITPGQAVVCYDDDAVACGGTIVEADGAAGLLSGSCLSP